MDFRWMRLGIKLTLNFFWFQSRHAKLCRNDYESWCTKQRIESKLLTLTI